MLSSFTMNELVDCPACEAELDVPVRTVEAPATPTYPGHVEQHLERPVVCACGRPFTDSDLPDPVDESDGYG